MSKCIGCGITLQNNDSNLPGYVKDLSYPYCERCFRNKNYSEIKEEELKISNTDIINKINQNSSLTFFVVDFLNINEEIINLYKDITTNKYLVVNKIDIIPKDVNFNKISSLLSDKYGIKDKIIYTSNKNNNLSNYFDDNKMIYFCGITNSGKTSLISKISSNDDFTKSSMINTTQDFITIKCDDYKIVDSPGFIVSTNKVDQKYLKLINPSKRIKVRNYQVKDNTTLNIHDLIKITFIDKNNVSCYLSNGLLIKKEYQNIEGYKEVEINDNSDLIIKGIGFLNIKNKGVIRIPSNLEYEIRSSIF